MTGLGFERLVWSACPLSLRTRVQNGELDPVGIFGQLGTLIASITCDDVCVIEGMEPGEIQR